MNRNKYLPLTETTFYILTALLVPGHGYAAIQENTSLRLTPVRTRDANYTRRPL